MIKQLRASSMMLLALACSLALGVVAGSRTEAQDEKRPARPSLDLPKLPGGKPRNIIFILTDDHRYDAMGFMNHPFLETPHLDYLAKNGVHVRNATVTTALCSPSRASILTGVYAHKHRVIDNNHKISPDLVFFPEYLQRVGYETAFVGKWHMGGEGDDPQQGFDHWVSFRGQGTYLPNRSGLNVNGQRVPQKGYITDELTDYALDWLQKRSGDRPFFLYLSHKAVHADFVPAERHKGRYKDKTFVPPVTMANTPENYEGKPMWVKNQRNSWHGVDFPYHSDLDVGEYYKRYCESFLSVDDSIGRVLDYLRSKRLLDSTLILYMGDNGFMFGEHGLIDKRCAYEASMRVPMVAHCPELFPKGTKVEEVVANIDVAPTLLEAAGLEPPKQVDGQSFLPLLRGQKLPWRDSLLYEYYWERNFPQTPTMFAVRGQRYKYIRYHGIWDTDELYDLQNDPDERKNLIRSPEHAQIVRQMNRQLFRMLEDTEGMQIPVLPDRNLGQSNLRRKDGPTAAEFPPHLLREPQN